MATTTIDVILIGVLVVVMGVVMMITTTTTIMMMMNMTTSTTTVVVAQMMIWSLCRTEALRVSRDRRKCWLGTTEQTCPVVSQCPVSDWPMCVTDIT